MIHNIFLISEKTLKKRSLITDPTLSVYIKPAIEIAQKIGLREILGDCLIEKLQILVSTKNESETGFLINEPEYIHYKDLLNSYITDYLVYQTMSEAVIPMRDKMRNAGIVNNADNNYQQPDFNEITYTKRYWSDNAAYFGTMLRQYVENHLDWFKEYDACDTCNDKNGKQKSIYNCGIVL